MELLKDYNYIILYHLEEANMVTDTLSHKFVSSLAYIVEMKRPLISEFYGLKANGVKFKIKELRMLLAHVELHSSFLNRNKAI